MIGGIGVDIVRIERMKQAMRRTERFADRVFTAAEQAYILRGPTPHYESAAAMFAAKESIAKALGTGFNGFGLRDIEIRHAENGAPYAVLYGEARNRVGDGRVWISLTHEKEYAVAQAVWEKQEEYQ